MIQYRMCMWWCSHPRNKWDVVTPEISEVVSVEKCLSLIIVNSFILRTDDNASKWFLVILQNTTINANFISYLDIYIYLHIPLTKKKEKKKEQISPPW